MLNSDCIYNWPSLKWTPSLFLCFLFYEILIILSKFGIHLQVITKSSATNAPPQSEFSLYSWKIEKFISIKINFNVFEKAFQLFTSFQDLSMTKNDHGFLRGIPSPVFETQSTLLGRPDGRSSQGNFEINDLFLINQSRQGGDKRPPPDFQNSSKKMISHRFRVIKV